MLNFDTSTLGTFLKEKLRDYQPEMISYDYGTVESCADGIVRVAGLGRAEYGELLQFENDVYGIALDLGLNSVGAALLTRNESVRPGSPVQGTGRVADIGVGKELLGRIVDPIGRPLDGQTLHTRESRAVESPAPAIMDRAPVDTPMETGILAVDSMIPIGRGQRELIIGDRQTGKTSIALSAMVNQKDTGVICVYCAIGQKAASVANLVHTLQESGTMEHTVVVASTAADSSAMQYLAPYAACAVAEYFMYNGQDALVVYDDLSKHAVAYRTMSLLLRRSPGREAYPGDVFYLHSRLLERACRLTKEYGGGSMTALPIIETQAGDVSAYIPTNVISITDGQIYLESDLFFAGQRPAVNVGLSVSRVGGSAQTRAIKKTAGTLRIDLARFRELEVFTQFASDLDSATQQTLDHGRRLLELLKQPLYHPMPVSRQAMILYVATNGLVDDVPLDKVRDLVLDFAQEMEHENADVAKEIQSTGNLSGPAIEVIRSVLEDVKKRVSATWQA